ncbi:hypothetical protein SCLCIDRAFT_105257 [Scleroderma citrinum Foug A]|uniref:Uncharacterized protein n=1 Tax=Scleroderma citrinum Foug A TaxID=1036808 RepID=A0A0C3EKF4_9AGAM|nr:hypothetical protein SCLCIDRAFT_105257 [Scleroderma citrinum Foug A]
MSVFLCRELRDKNPDAFPSGLRFSYQPRTANANLRNHILSNHLHTYLDEAEKNGWQIFLEYVQDAFTNGYTFSTIREALRRPGVTICSLPPAPMTNSNPSQPLPGAPALTSLEAGLPSFSQATLHEHLVRFVLSDDQVRFSPLVFRHNSILLTL